MTRYALIAFTTFLFAIGLPTAARASAPDTLGAHGCPHCSLSGTDLSNQCLQHDDFEGTDFDNAKLVLTCFSHADLKHASFRGADLSGANLYETKLDGADFTGAVLSSTSLKSADLRRVKGLTQAQLNLACGDAQTRLPAGLHVKICK